MNFPRTQPSINMFAEWLEAGCVQFPWGKPRDSVPLEEWPIAYWWTRHEPIEDEV